MEKLQMSEENQKWLTDQLLDIFEKQIQIKDLNPALIGKTKEKDGIPSVNRYKNSPKFTSSIKLLLLAIAKYPVCIMGIKKLAKIASLTRTRTIEYLKLLDQNNITSVIGRISEAGDADSNSRSLNMDILKSFFGDEVVSQRHQGSVTVTLGVVSQRHPIKKEGFTKGNKQTKSFCNSAQKESNKRRHPFAPMMNEAANTKKNKEYKQIEITPEIKALANHKKPPKQKDNHNNQEAMKIMSEKLGIDLNNYGERE